MQSHSSNRLPQSSAEPALPPVSDTHDTLFAVVVSVMTSRVSQYGGKEKEASSGPGGYGNTHRNNGREGVYDDEHRCAVASLGVVTVDEVKLQVEGWCKESLELF